MKIYEFEGVRTYRRSPASAAIAKRIAIDYNTNKSDGWTLALGAARLRGDRSLGATYLSIQRALPFEYEGLVFKLIGGFLHAGAARLENIEPPPRRASNQAVIDLVRAEAAKLEPFISIYGLREETRKLLEGVEERLMKKITEEVKKALTVEVR